MIEIAVEGETLLYVLGTVVSAFAIWGAYRGEMIARRPSLEALEINKRIDGFCDTLLNMGDKIAEQGNRITVLEEKPSPEPAEPVDYVEVAKTLRKIGKVMAEDEE